jgi:predicted ATP-grasp superfamily ATP-dependent carboligase
MRPSDTGVPAVILSGNLGKSTAKRSLNEAALALTRSLGRHGVRVVRFHPDRSLVDLSSRYCTHAVYPNFYDDPSGAVDALVAFSLHSGTRPVLFPASDGAAQFIADHEQSLQDHFVFSSPGAVCIAKTQHKRELIEIARASGIPVPETYFPTDACEVADIARRISYPLIIKPVYSPDWKRSAVTAVFGQVKAMKVFEPRQLISLCGALLALNSVFMVQEIVPGSDEDLITFLGYVSHDGEVLAGCVRKKLRQFPPGFGYCCLTESVDDQEVFDLSVKLFQALDYRGIGCAEFKRDRRDGTPRLIEINTRAVRTSMLAIAAGVDFPWIAYQDCVKPGAVAPVLEGKVPVRWVHLRDEIWAASRLILSGELSFMAWARGFLGKPVVVAEFSWDDMWPGLLCWAQVPVQLVKMLARPKPGPNREQPTPAVHGAAK